MDIEGILLSILVIGMLFLGIGFGIHIGVDVGHIDVASGKYHCELKSNSDKTTKWGCYKVKEEK